MPFPDPVNCYPHKLARLDSCMGWAAQQRFDEHQLESATKVFLSRFKKYNETFGAKSALSVEQKESVVPYLKRLVACGWSAEHGTAILESRDYDTKSLDRAEIAFKSIGALSAAHGMEHRHAMHIAMHYIGRVLEEAVKAGFNPNQPRHPAGSSVGGEWSGGEGGTSPSSNRRRSEGYGRHRINLPDDKPLESVMLPHNQLPGNIDDAINQILEGGGGRGFGGGPTTSRGKPVRKTIKEAAQEKSYLKELRELPKDVVETGKGGHILGQNLKSKFRRWVKDNKSLNPEGLEITNFSDGRTIYTFKSPGKASGSYRVYDKQVDVNGKTISARVVTIDANGMRVHTKDKITKKVVEYDTTTGEIKRVYYEEKSW